MMTDIDRYLDDGGRLTIYPSKRKNKIFAILYLAEKFELGKEYSEKQVNEILMQWHTFGDHVMLRRELFTHGILGRTVDCKRYWAELKQPSFDDLMKLYS